LTYRHELDTPCLIVHKSILDTNIREMASLARERGLALRPHQKTHKTAEIARLQVEAGASGVTCAKLGEAEALVDAGVVNDVFIAYQIVGPHKVKRLLALMDRATVRVAVDSVAGAEPLSCACDAVGRTLDVVIEVNSGLDRAGILPGQPVLDLAREIQRMPGLRLRGIMTHEGHAGKTVDLAALQATAQAAGQAMRETAALLRDAGIEIDVVSVGSTPAAFVTTSVDGVTEMRPGTYVFNDNSAFRFGRLGLDRCALRALSTVISTPSPNRAVIDAGSKTLTSDPPSPGRSGFGYIIEYPDAVILRLSEEHGVVEFPNGSASVQVGDVLEIIPNHVCPTVNLHDALVVIENDRVVATWDVIARGKVR
jgi:D-serine deaminase-like pyridoxal phosphate-dependent protein